MNVLTIQGDVIHLEEHAYLLEKGSEEQTYKEIAWKFLFQPLSYQATGAEREQEIFAALEHVRTGVHLAASDFSDFGKKVFANIVKNMERLPRSYDGGRWFGAFENIPAVICGAGPSFAKNSDCLKTIEGRALLFGGGSALNVLAHAGIVPHFAAGIDPDPPRDRWEGQAALDIPFFYQHRVSSELLARVKGPRLFIKDGAAHPIEKWFYDHLPLLGPELEAGWNAATFSTALAVSLGCNPIIFVGLDLCLEEGKCYAPGVEGERKEAPKDWEMAGLWLEALIQAHPHLRFINATEGGRGIAGAEAMQLKDIALSPQEDLRRKIRAQPLVFGPGAHESIHALKQSLERCLEMYQAHLAFPLSRVAAVDEEIAYAHILAPLWNIWQHLFARHVPPDTFEGSLNRTLFFKNVTEQLLYAI